MILKAIIRFLEDNYGFDENQMSKETTLADVKMDEGKFQKLQAYLEVQFGVKLLPQEVKNCVSGFQNVTLGDLVSIVYVKKCCD